LTSEWAPFWNACSTAIGPISDATYLKVREGGRIVSVAAIVAVAVVAFAVVGEVKATMAVKYEVVRSAQGMTINRIEQALDLARGQIHPLNPPTGIILWLMARHHQATKVRPSKAAVIADIHGPIGTEGCAVWPPV
jgi:hypothetical protein